MDSSSTTCPDIQFPLRVRFRGLKEKPVPYHVFCYVKRPGFCIDGMQWSGTVHRHQWRSAGLQSKPLKGGEVVSEYQEVEYLYNTLHTFEQSKHWTSVWSPESICALLVVVHQDIVREEVREPFPPILVRLDYRSSQAFSLSMEDMILLEFEVHHQRL